MIPTKGASPPPYTPVPAPGQPSAVGDGQLRTYQPAEVVGVAVLLEGQGGPLLPTHRERDYTVEDTRARRRFLAAFWYAVVIWLIVGFFLGMGVGGGRHRHGHRGDGRWPDEPNSLQEVGSQWTGEKGLGMGGDGDGWEGWVPSAGIQGEVVVLQLDEDGDEDEDRDEHLDWDE